MNTSNTSQTIGQLHKQIFDEYVEAGFTREEALDLLKERIRPVPYALPSGGEPFKYPMDPPYRVTWSEPPHVTCEHTGVIEALVENAGGLRENGAGQRLTGRGLIRCP